MVIKPVMSRKAVLGPMLACGTVGGGLVILVNAIPLVEDADRIKIVSNPLHAQKARLYLHRERPDLARKLVRAKDYRPGEWAPLKPFFAVYGLRRLTKAA